MAHSQSQSHKDTLAALLNAQNNYKLSIITLSEQVSPGPAKKQLSGERTSDVSADDLLDATPAKLEEDLAHYKVLIMTLSEGIKSINRSSISRISFQNSASLILSK